MAIITHSIVVKDLVVGYFGTPVLHGISFEINEPGIYVVLGKNGAGKTTLFRTLSGILAPHIGSVRIDGEIPYKNQSIRRRLAFLSHLDALPEGYTAREALRIFAEIGGVHKDRIEEVANFMGITDLLDMNMDRLSRGQKRRVAMAKSILGEKDIYLMDEPTSGIDPKGVSDIRSLLLDLAREKIILYSSHNLLEAMEIGSNVIALGEGELKFFGNIDTLQENRFTVGIRAEGVQTVIPEAHKQGRYYLVQLENPDQMNDIIDRLRDAGIMIREIREMDNPLEKFFE